MLIISEMQRMQLFAIRYQLQQQDRHLQLLYQKALSISHEEGYQIQLMFAQLLQENRIQLQYLKDILG